jgi:hypothetical protein
MVARAIAFLASDQASFVTGVIRSTKATFARPPDRSIGG